MTFDPFRLRVTLARDSSADPEDVRRTKSALAALGDYAPPDRSLDGFPDRGLFEGLTAFQKRSGLRPDGQAKPGGPTETAMRSQLAARRHDPSGARAVLARRRQAERADAEARATARAESRTATGSDRGFGLGTAEAARGGGRPAARHGGAVQRAADERPDAAPFRLAGSVGRQAGNAAADVVAAKRALGWAGYYTAPEGQQPTPRAGAAAAAGALDGALLSALDAFQRDFQLARDGLLLPDGPTQQALNLLIAPLIAEHRLSARGRAGASTAAWRPQPGEAEGSGEAAHAPPPARNLLERGRRIAQASAPGQAGAGWGDSTAWAMEQTARDVAEAAKEAGRAVRETAGSAAAGVLRLGAEVGRAVGLENAADNLDHFLDGTGTDRRLTREEARERSPVAEGERKNQQRFEQAFVRDRLEGANPQPEYEYGSHLLALKDGEVIHLPGTSDVREEPEDAFQAPRSYWESLRRLDVHKALATGDVNFVSVAQQGFVATRYGDIVELSGVVTHTWDDRYDFNKPGPDTPIANAARYDGGAAEYYNRAQWRQLMIVRYRLFDGELEKLDAQWIDIDE